ncbi:MAG: TonB-dependent receptor domain-containing protein [Acidobacteriota bacterium]
MKLSKLLLATALGLAGQLGTHLLDPATARAQNATTGAIQGIVTDKKTGEPMAGVTVVVSSTALNQTQTAITDDKGTYRVTDLPPGDYDVTFYFADISVAQNGVRVGINKTAPVYQKIDQTQAGGETIKVEAKAPTIDPTSTTQGITIDKEYLNNVPVPGRTFEAALGAAAGSQGDAMGVAFSGSTSLENQYYVDGVNTTGLTFGTIGSPVVNDFIEEIEVITGGYQAEYGRATGGVVNVVTKSGSNEFKGSVWGFWQPGALTAAAKVTPINAGSIDAVGNVAYNADFGFELGGPIIKDKLWYFVGFDPMFNQIDYTRYTKRQTDCRTTADPVNGIPQGPIAGLSNCEKQYADGTPDIDPKTGFFITDPLDSEVRSANTHTYNILTKINYAATPEHQGQISFQALPGATTQPGIFGPADQGGGFTASQLTTDVSAKWTSKFNDNKTEVEAVVGWHRDNFTSDPLNQMYAQEPLQVLHDGNLYTWGKGYGESPSTVAGCFDDANPNSTQDPYPRITNCPMSTRAYVIGGIGSINRDTEQRESARLSFTERLKAGGNHEIKGGIDAENNTSDKARLYSGGAFLQNYLGSAIYVDRWVQLGGNTKLVDNPDPAFFNKTCSTPNPFPTGPSSSSLDFYCSYLSGVPGSRGTQIQGNTFNWAAYLRDSWQIQPNLTLNVGLRYEEQQLRYASFLQNTVDPLTQEKLGTSAMDLKGNWAPRVGLLYDWTKEGRSKIYVNYGRYYESIPMDINDRSFGGEVTQEQVYQPKTCGGMTDPNIGGINGKNCLTTTASGDLNNHLIGASGELIEPGISAEYLDEYIGGAEYEILDDLKIGVAFQHRSFGRVIEDVSTDGANTYIIANPGEFSASDESAFQQRIDRTDDPTAKARLQHELDLYRGIRTFDTARRDYNALQFTLTRRFSKSLYVQGSYTYSRTQGNYPGSFSPDNGQVDPNISSQFDLIELLANRIGPLPQDRPHYIKLDGYYTFDFKKKGTLTTGIRLRALSGTPENALAAHYLYGPDESFLLPRGELGRSDFDHGLDMQFSYGKNLSKGMKLEFILTLYNIYDRQGTAAVDNTYAPAVKLSQPNGASGTPQNANPVSGGTYDDLIWVKTIDQTGVEQNVPIGRNPNFHNTIQRYGPTYAQLGVRLTF